jgi:hypothetical protein
MLKLEGILDVFETQIDRAYTLVLKTRYQIGAKMLVYAKIDRRQRLPNRG